MSSNIDQMDLNISNYTIDELFNLFNLNVNNSLTDDDMKYAKKIVLKVHPDKSKLDSKYYIFFTKAYNLLQNIYEFKNKSQNKKIDNTTYENKQQKQLLHNLFEKNTELKKIPNFNKWFNSEFEKYKINDDEDEINYNEWMKSDTTLSTDINARKKEIRALTVYKGVSDNYIRSSVGGASLLHQQNCSSTDKYTDLKKAYDESVLPDTEDDFANIKVFSSVNEYNNHRNSMNTSPLSTDLALRQLYLQEENENSVSAALAYKYAKQMEQIEKNNSKFWGSLNKLTY